MSCMSVRELNELKRELSSQLREPRNSENARGNFTRIYRVFEKF